MTDSGLWHFNPNLETFPNFLMWVELLYIEQSVKQWQIYHLRIGFTFGALTEDPDTEVTTETHMVYNVEFGSHNQDTKCLRNPSSVTSAASDQDDINL